MASPFPLSARDVVEFRPATAAVIAARDVLEKAQAEAGVDAVAAAQAALEAAEAALAKRNPVYLLRPPTGKTKALVNYAVNADPCVPRLRDNTELLQTIEAEAADAGLLEVDLAAIAEAKPLVAAGQVLTGDLWAKVYGAAQDTAGGRRIIAGRLLFNELRIRHWIAHHLILSDAASPLAGYKPLSERDLDAIDNDDLRAINLELDRLSELTKADAKNSAAP